MAPQILISGPGAPPCHGRIRPNIGWPAHQGTLRATWIFVFSPPNPFLPRVPGAPCTAPSHKAKQLRGALSPSFPHLLHPVGWILPPPSPAIAVGVELTSFLLFSFCLRGPMLTAPASSPLLPKQSCHAVLITSGLCFNAF